MHLDAQRANSCLLTTHGKTRNILVVSLSRKWRQRDIELRVQNRKIREGESLGASLAREKYSPSPPSSSSSSASSSSAASSYYYYHCDYADIGNDACGTGLDVIRLGERDRFCILLANRRRADRVILYIMIAIKKLAESSSSRFSSRVDICRAHGAWSGERDLAGDIY